MSVIPWQVWAGLGGLALIVLFWWWLTRTLRKQGAAERDLKAARASGEVKNEQLQIAANRPDADGVDSKLRAGKF
jgi:hypothetical protein